MAKNEQTDHCYLMTLEELKDDFLKKPMSDLRLVETRYSGNRMSLIFLREPPFQVELVIWSAGLVMEAHCHPNLDSLGVHVSGDACFITGDTEEDTNGFLQRARIWPANKIHNLRHPRARPGEWHGGKAGPTGAIFWSFQEWLPGAKMSAAGVDYVGPKLPPPQLCSFQ